LQEVVLSETTTGEIEVMVDGNLRGRVHGLNEVPIASFYGKNGEWLEDRVILSPAALAHSVLQIQSHSKKS